jgi:thiol-disulfide isomerase/thioredoxin
MIVSFLHGCGTGEGVIEDVALCQFATPSRGSVNNTVSWCKRMFLCRSMGAYLPSWQWVSSSVHCSFSSKDPPRGLYLYTEVVNDAHDRLIEFYGTECIHCARMTPVVDAVERELGRPIVKLEVWHDEENARTMEEHADVLRDVCEGLLGVPAFYNEATGEALCGEQDRDVLLAWAVGKART